MLWKKGTSSIDVGTYTIFHYLNTVALSGIFSGERKYDMYSLFLR